MRTPHPKAPPQAQGDAGNGPAADHPPLVPEPGAVLAAYRTLARATAPIAPLLLHLRARRGKEDPTRAAERLGKPSQARPKGPLVWLHAASVGETNAILPLIGALKKRAPKLTLLLTTGTVTSAKLAQMRLPKGAIHQFAPLDMPQFITVFLDHWKPDTAIFAESEIWPNLVLSLAERKIPLALVNGRLSERSFRRWAGHPNVSSPLFGRFALVLTQNEEAARRFAALGTRHARAVGNLKMDGPPPPADGRDLKALRALTRGRPIVLAASTHPGEDEAVIAAHIALAGHHDKLLTVIAPRHPERGGAIAALAERAGLQARRRSMGGKPDAACDIYIADTVGELGLFYALAPVALIGGSLITHGGQNPIEAVKHGCCVVTGPNIENFTDAYEALCHDDACTLIKSGDELVPVFAKLLGNGAGRAAMTVRAKATVAAMAGALDRTIAALGPLLPAAHRPKAEPAGRRGSRPKAGRSKGAPRAS